VRGLSRGFRGHAPRKNFEFRVSEMPFLDFGGIFDRNLMVRKRHYNVSKFAIWLEYLPAINLIPILFSTDLMF
jgi:hypothetical protein